MSIRNYVCSTTSAFCICLTPALAQTKSDVITIELLGRAVVASRDCGDDTAFSPQLVSVYIQKFAAQEGISFEKAKYMAISQGDEFLLELISSQKKDEFCLKAID